MIPTDREPAIQVRWSTIALVAAVIGGLWALDLYVLRTSLLVARKNQFPWTPLYAFFEPAWRAGAWTFVVAAAWLVARGPELAEPERCPRVRFLAVLALAGLVLPFALFLVRQEPGELGDLPALFGYRDLAQDAAQVGDARTFLHEYVRLMPGLSLHGQHYPPGPALYLHAWQSVLGPAPAVYGLAVLAAFVAALAGAYAAVREIAGERAGRQAALLLLATPALLDHACTAMDVVFLAAATWTVRLALVAFRPDASRRAALIASAWLGVLLFACTFVSFSALPLGLFVGILGLSRGGLLRGPSSLARLGVVGVAYAASAWAMQLATGFAIWECLHEAREHAAVFMGRIIRGTPHATWPYRTYGNLVAFLIGCGVTLVPVLVARLRSRRDEMRAIEAGAASGAVGGERRGMRTGAPRNGVGSAPTGVLAPLRANSVTAAALLTLGVMTFAPIYFMETERIWLYATPWLAAAALGTGGLDRASLRRLLAAGCVQALVMEWLLFTYW